MRDCLPCGALTRKAALSNLRQQPGMSPSVWFPDGLEYMKTKTDTKLKRVYLSLGDREERTRNAAMRQVGQNIREMDSCYKTARR